MLKVDGLPDARTAQRLLDVLALLEQSLRTGRHTASAGNSQLESHVANLQFENQRLRTSRQQASQRLGQLMERLQTQLEATKTPEGLEAYPQASAHPQGPAA